MPNLVRFSFQMPSHVIFLFIFLIFLGPEIMCENSYDFPQFFKEYYWNDDFLGGYSCFLFNYPHSLFNPYNSFR
jgi:hypothetical protein